jgi:hypothetical protein
MRFEQKRFEGGRVDLDGNTFVGCHFVECKLIFRGQGWPRFDGCLFTQCDWVFDDAAELTLEFLAWMYRGLSDAGPGLIDEMITKIKHGELFEVAMQRNQAVPA